MRSDPLGAFWTQLIIAVVAGLTTNDILNAFGVGTAPLSYAYTKDNESVQITNSNKIITPWIQYATSLYLNHFSEYSDYFVGTTIGMTYEWTLHNTGAVVFDAIGSTMNAIGLDGNDMIYKGESCKALDLGPTIYDDAETPSHGIFSKIMEGTYNFLFPVAGKIDYLAKQINDSLTD